MPAPSVRPSAPSQPNNGTTTATKPAPVRPSGKKGQEVRKIVYPRYQVLIYCNPTPDAATGEMVEYEGPITVALAKKILGWETEDEYVRRRLTEDPDLKEAKLRASDYLLKDRHGSKIRCRFNTTNRPFDERHARKIAQDVLSHKFEMNLEDIIIGVTGLVLSGQHRLIGVVLAGEEWEMQEHWKAKWDTEPFIEAVVAVGCREDQKVLQTFDNVKPRALSDTIYTSPMFANKSAEDKKRCSVMVDQGVDWLWRRLDATSNKFIEYQTHSASLDFLDRHKKLVAAVKHIHDLDGEEGLSLSNIGLNAGRSAGMCYLMGSSGTNEEDADAYHTSGSPKKESQLDWTQWDRALQFWTDVGQGRPTKKKDDKGNTVYERPEWVQELQNALSNLNDENLTGRVTDLEKTAVVALAWAEYSQGNEFFTAEDIVPTTAVDPNSNTRYFPDGEPHFGFVDRGSPSKQRPAEKQKGTTDPTPDEIAEEMTKIKTENARKLRAEELDKAAKGKKPPTEVKADVAKKVVPTPSPKNPGTLNGDDEFSLVDEDALTEHMNVEHKAKRKVARAKKSK